MNKRALPVSYGPRHIGTVYIGTSSSESPLTVCEQQPGDDPERTCIVIEFENHLGVASQEMFDNLGIPRDIETTLRLALHLSDARRLCHSLMTVLAGTGGAGVIHEMMINAISELRKRDQANPENSSREELF